MLQNLSLDTIIQVLKLNQENSETLFNLFDEDQTEVCDFYKGQFRYSFSDTG
jgi:hypothetical protein